MPKKEPMHHFHLVLPESLFKKVQKLAEQNRRSVTQQAIVALEWSTREIENHEPTQHVR